MFSHNWHSSAYLQHTAERQTTFEPHNYNRTIAWGCSNGLPQHYGRLTTPGGLYWKLQVSRDQVCQLIDLVQVECSSCCQNHIYTQFRQAYCITAYYAVLSGFRWGSDLPICNEWRRIKIFCLYAMKRDGNVSTHLLVLTMYFQLMSGLYINYLVWASSNRTGHVDVGVFSFELLTILLRNVYEADKLS